MILLTEKEKRSLLDHEQHLKYEKELRFKELENPINYMKYPSCLYDGKKKRSAAEFFGQRKLLISEIYPLVAYHGDIKNVLYIGAAPGTHIAFFANIFPNIKFYLYDKARFAENLKNYKNIIIIQDFFLATSKLPDGIKARDTLFISDIRLSEKQTKEYDELPKAVKDIYIKNAIVDDDMKLQAKIAKAHEFRASLLKFKLPFSFIDRQIFNSYEYLEGEIMFQSWSKASNETRLLVTEYIDMTYSPFTYENMMNYFQQYGRTSYYPHSREGYCHCFDCANEVMMIEMLEKVIGRKIERKEIDDATNGPLFLYDTIREKVMSDIPHNGIERELTYINPYTKKSIIEVAAENDDVEFVERCLFLVIPENNMESYKKIYKAALKVGSFRSAYLFRPKDLVPMDEKIFRISFNQNIPSIQLIKYLAIDNEALSIFITRSYIWNGIKDILKPLGLQGTITDAFASVGGDTINFGEIFSKINAIELDEARYLSLLNNVAVYGMKNTSCFLGDFSQCKGLNQDYLYFDPPWSNEKLVERSINLAKEMLEDGKVKMVFFKLPIDYDMKDYSGRFKIDSRIIETRNGGGVSFHIMTAVKGHLEEVKTPFKMKELTRTITYTLDKPNIIIFRSLLYNEDLQKEALFKWFQGLYPEKKIYIDEVPSNASDDYIFFSLKQKTIPSPEPLASLILLDPDVKSKSFETYSGEIIYPIFGDFTRTYSFVHVKRGAKLIKMPSTMTYINTMKYFHNNMRNRSYEGKGLICQCYDCVAYCQITSEIPESFKAKLNIHGKIII